MRITSAAFDAVNDIVELMPVERERTAARRRAHHAVGMRSQGFFPAGAQHFDFVFPRGGATARSRRAEADVWPQLKPARRTRWRHEPVLNAGGIAQIRHRHPLL